MKKIILSLLLIISMTPIHQVLAEEKEVKEDSKVSIEQYHKNISGIKELNSKRIISLINSNKSYYLFIGFQECPYCREFSKELNIFKHESKFPIYYLDISKDYSILPKKDLQKLQKFLVDDIELSGTPTFLKIQKQNVTANFVGADTTINQLREINYK